MMIHDAIEPDHSRRPAVSCPPRQGRAALGGDLWARTVGLTAIGGAAVGTTVMLAAAVSELLHGDGERALQLAAFSLVVAFFGGLVGVFLGLAAGAFVGLAGARVLVPNPGRRSVLRFSRLAGLLVALTFDVLVYLLLGGAGSLVLAAPLPLAFGWLLAPALVRWYIIENERIR